MIAVLSTLVGVLVLTVVALILGLLLVAIVLAIHKVHVKPALRRRRMVRELVTSKDHPIYEVR